MSGLIRTEPCGSCDLARTERETGAGYCVAYGVSFDCCPDWLQVHRLEDIAGQVAALYCHESDESLRREMAQATADGFANALYLQGKGAEFDTDAFLSACDVHSYAGVRG